MAFEQSTAFEGAAGDIPDALIEFLKADIGADADM
jgi:hypothetical protein